MADFGKAALSQVSDLSNKVNKKLIGESTEIIAHRGFMYSAPQNTMSAFSYAIAAGAQSLETDVKITLDGVSVLSHDDDLSINTNGTGKIYEKNLSEVQQYDAGSKFNPKFAGAIIPTFDEMLKFAKGKVKMVYPEVKGYRTIDDIKIMVDVVKNNQMENNCCFCSFQISELMEVRKYSSSVKIALLKDASYPNDSEIDFLRKDVNAAIMPPYNSITVNNPNLAQDMFSKGIDVICWNVYSFKIAQDLVNKGVTKLISDYYYGGL